jgi:hypothetical protein
MRVSPSKSCRDLEVRGRSYTLPNPCPIFYGAVLMRKGAQGATRTRHETSLARVRVFLLAGTYAGGYSEEAPPLAGLALVDQ